MAKNIFLALLIAATVILAAGNVAAKDFIVKQIKVGLEGVNNDVQTLPNPNKKEQSAYFSITKGMKPLVIKVIGNGERGEELLTFCLVRVSSRSNESEPLLYCLKTENRAVGFSCYGCGKLQGASAINFFFGNFKYAEVKVKDKKIEIKFFVPQNDQNTEENNFVPREIYRAGP